MNTGEVVVRSIQTGDGHTEYTPIGHATNLAARMQTLAPTGSIAVSEATQQTVRRLLQLPARWARRGSKGVSEPVNVYEVTGLGPLRTQLQRAARRGLTKFVGREREMAAMAARWSWPERDTGRSSRRWRRRASGKSRLFYEFKATSQIGCMVLEAFSVSHGKASA